MMTREIKLSIQVDSTDDDYVEIMKDDLIRMVEAILRREIVQTLVTSHVMAN